MIILTLPFSYQTYRKREERVDELEEVGHEKTTGC